MVESYIFGKVEETKSIENKNEVEGELINVGGESFIIIKVVDNLSIVDDSVIEVVDNFGMVDDTVIKVFDNSGKVEDSFIKVVDNSGIVVGGGKGEVEIIVVWIKVVIKSGIEVKAVDSFSNKVVKGIGIVVDSNIVVGKGKVVGIISFLILKPVSSILVLQVSVISNNFNS